MLSGARRWQGRSPRLSSIFVGSAKLAFVVEPEPAIRAIIGPVPTKDTWAQTVFDFAVNRPFRMDIFQRRIDPIDPATVEALLDEERIAGRSIVPETDYRVEPVADVTLLPDEASEKFSRLVADRCPTFGEPYQELGISREHLIHLLRCLIHADKASSARQSPADRGPAERFNNIVTGDDPLFSRYTSLASPVLGNGVAMNHQAFLVREAVRKHGLLPAQRLAEEMEAILVGGRRLHKSETIYADEVALKADLARAAQRVAPRVWPLMQRLGLD